MVPDGEWGRFHALLHLLLVISRTTWQNCLLLAQSKKWILVKKYLCFFCREQNSTPAGSFEGSNAMYGLPLSPAHARCGAAGEHSPLWWSRAAHAGQTLVRVTALLLAHPLEMFVPSKESWQLLVHTGIKSLKRWAVGSKCSEGRKDP